jgi:hypothetical protein
MKWFDKWFANKCKEAWENANSPVETEREHAISSGLVNRTSRKRNTLVAGSDSEMRSDPITFKMFKANGGWAIEFNQYDNKNDRMDNALYVVNNEEELGNSISKIITMEALKR